MDDPKGKIKDEILMTMVKEFMYVKETVSNLSACFEILGLDGYGTENATLISNMDSFQPVQGAIQNIFSNSFINDCSSSNSSKYDKTMTPPCHFEEPTIRTPLSQTNFVDHTETINATEHEDSLTRLCILPYVEMKIDAFKYFNASALENSTHFTHLFSNRSAAYYGDHPYHYGRITHEPQDFGKNPYLQKLLNYVEIVYPDLQFNSALINLYNSGKDHLPHHSDDEEEIIGDSVILTISLGSTRNIEFRDKNTSLIAESVSLPHGSSFTMTRLSQNYFTHSITPCAECSEKRISVTLRLVQPSGLGYPTPVEVSHEDLESVSGHSLASQLDNLYNDNDEWLPDADNLDIQLDGDYMTTPTPIIINHLKEGDQPTSHTTSAIHIAPNNPADDNMDLNSLNDGYQPAFSSLVSKTNTRYKGNDSQDGPNNSPTQSRTQTVSSEVDTIYVSSSMFRHLDSKGLSSNTQQALVFFYPGANSAQMLQRLLKDPQYKALKKDKIKRVILLTGTNYVDSLFSGTCSFQSAVKDINDLAFHMWSSFINANICVLNILPRSNNVKNKIISELNSEIKDMCSKHGLLFGDTEAENFLFSDDNGQRKGQYFMGGIDNVHLNEMGVTRLAKHLKFISHKCLT